MPEMTEDPEGYWNDEAADKWVRAQGAVDRMVRPITAFLLEAAAAKPGERVLDVGCGCGTTTLAFSDAVGEQGRVVGLDISRPMLAEAKRRGQGRANLSFVDGDAGAYAFSGEGYDLLTSRFGVMFFPEPQAAFANLRGGLKPGGRVAMACWQGPKKNPWISFMMGAFPEVDPPLPGPDDGPGPFSLSNREQTVSLLEGAGFSDVRLEGFEANLRLGDSPDQVLEGLADVGPLARILGEAGEEGRAAVLGRARAYLEEKFRSGPPEPASAIWLMHARA